MLNEPDARLGHISTLRLVTLEGNPLQKVQQDVRRVDTQQLKAYWRTIAKEGAKFKDSNTI